MAKDISIELFTLADYVSVSKENKLTIAGIFDRFFVDKVPTNWPNISLVAIFRGVKDSEHVLHLEISNENKDKKILDQEFTVKIGENGKSNFITSLQNFPLLAFGTYQVIISEGKKELGVVEFFVNKSKKTSDSALS